jgi:hypothetical protein
LKQAVTAMGGPLVTVHVHVILHRKITQRVNKSRFAAVCFKCRKFKGRSDEIALEAMQQCVLN